MHNGKTVSLGSVIWKVFKNKLVTDLSYDDAAEYALEFIRLVGAPMAYINDVEKVKIKEHKAAIPANVIQIRGIKLASEGDRPDTALTYATDLYHQQEDCNENNNCSEDDFTYEMQKGIIFTSTKEGEIYISFKGLAVDKDGYPLVPDNEKFIMGLEYYIIHRYLEGLWALGKIADKVFHYYEQKRHWYLAAANSSLQMQNIDQLEATMNGLNRIVQSDYWHKEFFRKFGKQERIKKYN